MPWPGNLLGRSRPRGAWPRIRVQSPWRGSRKYQRPNLSVHLALLSCPATGQPGPYPVSTQSEGGGLRWQQRLAKVQLGEAQGQEISSTTSSPLPEEAPVSLSLELLFDPAAGLDNSSTPGSSQSSQPTLTRAAHFSPSAPRSLNLGPSGISAPASPPATSYH